MLTSLFLINKNVTSRALDLSLFLYINTTKKSYFQPKLILLK